MGRARKGVARGFPQTALYNVQINVPASARDLPTHGLPCYGRVPTGRGRRLARGFPQTALQSVQ